LAGNCSNTLIYNNEFTDCNYGIGVGYGTTGSKAYNNAFTNIIKYHIWVDRSKVEISGNTHNGAPGSINYYNYGGGQFIEK